MIVDLSILPISYNYNGTITFNDETAGYRNTLGMYTVAEDGTIENVQIIFANSSALYSGGDLIRDVSKMDYSFEAGTKIGFFLLPNSNGYSTASLLTDPNGTYIFRNNSGEMASIDDTGKLPLIHVAADGTETIIKTASGNLSWHSNPTMNADGVDHTFYELNVEGNKLTFSMRFEDLWAGGDKDYMDVVFTLDVGPANAVALTNEFASADIPLTLSDVAMVTSKGFLEVNPLEDFAGWTITGINGQAATAGAVITLSDGSTLTVGEDNSLRIDGAAHTSNVNQLVTLQITDGRTVSDVFLPVTVSPVDGTDGDDQIHTNTGFIKTADGSVAHGFIDADGNMVDGTDGGDEVIMGYGGNDKIFTGTGDDVIYGGTGNDHIRAHGGDDVLYGEEGDDFLGGEEGNDTMYGGSGDDFYFVDSTGDVTVELADEGYDKVRSSVDWTLSDHFEMLELREDAIFGGGNDISNTIHGNENNNRLLGVGGNDTLLGGEGDDTLDGGQDNDRLEGGAGDDLIIGGDGTDRLKGEEGNDEIWGGEGNDVIYGSDGDDILIGGEGNDALLGEGGADTFVFYDDGGKDRVYYLNAEDRMVFVGVDEDSLRWKINGNSASLTFGENKSSINFIKSDDFDQVEIEFYDEWA